MINITDLYWKIVKLCWSWSVFFTCKFYHERASDFFLCPVRFAFQEEDEEAFKKQFSRYIKLGISADSIEAMYKKAHAAIRADPAAKPKPKKEGVQKRWNAKKITLEQRKAKVAEAKAKFLAQIEAQKE